MSEQCKCRLISNNSLIFGAVGIVFGIVLSILFYYYPVWKQRIFGKQGSTAVGDRDYVVVDNVDVCTQKLAEANFSIPNTPNQTIALRKLGSKKLREAMSRGQTHQEQNINPKYIKKREQQNKEMFKKLDFILNGTSSAEGNVYRTSSSEPIVYGAGTVLQLASGTSKNVRKLSTKINHSFKQDFPKLESQFSLQSIPLQDGQVCVETQVIYDDGSDSQDGQEEANPEEVHTVPNRLSLENSPNRQSSEKMGQLVATGQFSSRREIWI
eukprot:TRINITY_DN2369_c0_g2_i1.p1 TRINITY_DN2369_c0_g2~~TRINITY_DN2369_c0_g2_i1.p1  ORF type:complete len:268 (+),score=10.89 TRINITY_DN2369_c0_g2_i1:138-941(+)